MINDMVKNLVFKNGVVIPVMWYTFHEKYDVVEWMDFNMRVHITSLVALEYVGASPEDVATFKRRAIGA